MIATQSLWLYLRFYCRSSSRIEMEYQTLWGRIESNCWLLGLNQYYCKHRNVSDLTIIAVIATRRIFYSRLKNYWITRVLQNLRVFIIMIIYVQWSDPVAADPVAEADAVTESLGMMLLSFSLTKCRDRAVKGHQTCCPWSLLCCCWMVLDKYMGNPTGRPVKIVLRLYQMIYDYMAQHNCTTNSS